MDDQQAMSLPQTHKALLLTSRDQPLEVRDLPTPDPIPGSAIVRILSATILSYSGEVYSGKRPYPFPTPLVPGTSCIGRIAALGPDSTSLHVGQLVLVDSIIRSRDNPAHIFLHGLVEGQTAGSRKLMNEVWRNGKFAEYTRVPLEVCYPLNEKLLCGTQEDGGFGYEVAALSGAFQMAVPYGGLRDIALQAGETVIVAPATGPFGGAAVRVALAMGARVIALGRNVKVLEKLVASAPAGRVLIVPLTQDADADAEALAKFGPVDAYFDISPTRANESHHIAMCIRALRHGGKVSFMGGLDTVKDFPHRFVMRWNITLKGTWMYSREQIRDLIRMIETGVLRLDDAIKVVGKYALEEWKEAFEVAGNIEPGKVVAFTP